MRQNTLLDKSGMQDNLNGNLNDKKDVVHENFLKVDVFKVAKLINDMKI